MSESEINDMLKHSPEDGHRALFDQYFQWRSVALEEENKFINKI
ncbi:hypothetical protein [Ruminococcus sp. XPD3002]|nr:hypothetical protein SAMN04487832_11114 [Ruminococcus flavefaciens]